MRFLVDECTGPAVAQWLKQQGHEVFSIYDEARGLDDDAILAKAYAENWILITIDADFGEKVFRDRVPHHGVVFLRLVNERAANKIAVLEQLLNLHASALPDQFVAVSDSVIRFAST